ncbi:MAG TPA: DUF4402 domain-containing protein [Bacteroidales bacterium]|nr:DUF4402 domain-containing protein [Bacteroidales bacterium]
MKTTLKIFTLTVAIFAFSNISFGQSSATANANAGANILKPIAITNTQDLDFGDIISQTTGFTVIVTTAGTRSASNATAILTAVGKQATFSVTGQESQSFKVTLPADGVVSIESGENSMNITDFDHNLGENPALDGTGKATLNVGAVLNVGATQAAGVYTGTFDVTVAYE